MSAVKNQPATPLPWRIAGDHESIELLGADGECINSAARASYGEDYKRVAADMNYERHAANAYPQLVAAVKHLRAVMKAKGGSTVNERVEALAITTNLLRELGEAS